MGRKSVMRIRKKTVGEKTAGPFPVYLEGSRSWKQSKKIRGRIWGHMLLGSGGLLFGTLWVQLHRPMQLQEEPRHWAACISGGRLTGLDSWISGAGQSTTLSTPNLRG